MNVLIPQSASSWLMVLFLGGAATVAAAAVLMLRRPVSEEGDPDFDDSDLRNGNRPGAGRDQRAEARMLAQAGFDHPLAVTVFYVVKLAAAALFAGLCLWLTMLSDLFADQTTLLRLLAAGVAGGLGFWLPSFVVEKRRSAWRRRIEIAIPDALDFMLVCVEAGQSLDLAAQRVSLELEAVHPDLAVRFQVLTKSLAAGADRQDAFNHLAQSTGNDDLRQFATLVVQSASMGTPVAHSLRVFAADLRDRRVRKVEEKAAVLPTKMSLGTMMFTVPPLLILLLAPSVYRITQLM
ncbi:type II secretion system F family protein [Falsigemmobacter faecalis]|uniref:Type II secretion system F family protein n=1 Tax=Falsigemmobacter faecalis TaxID=2488730 RepID=A0A3P3DRN8_9RHOB|nr:type II secretion system F family protein [Falsigemmobacter faecalis]RRH76907.1 type II secretion system F family protein [Falsigemmobacter faecalis]